MSMSIEHLAQKLIDSARRAEDANDSPDKRLQIELNRKIEAYKADLVNFAQDRDGFKMLRTANISRNAEWNMTGETLRPSFRGNEAGGETGEAIEAALANLLQLAVATGRMQNVLKKIERGQLGIKGSTATVEDLADELGDMQICLDLVAMDFKIDLFEATSRKFNRTSDKLGFETKL